MNRSFLAPLAFLYGAVVSVRHKLFDWGIMRSEEYDIPVVCVGNITVGGTGKTPVTELLAGHFRNNWNVAVLSRGYKRRTKGYVEVTGGGSFRDVGDEPKQIKLKYPDVVVAVCERRTEGIERIRRDYPQVNLIILDDGFQHRRVEPWVNIVLMDYNRPVYKDHLLPWGNLRDTLSQLHRAHYVIVTKCPPGMNPLERRIVRNSLGFYPYQNLYFSTNETEQPRPLFPEGNETVVREGTSVVAMSAIGNPRSFRDSLSLVYEVEDELVFPDHHPYRRRDLDAMSRMLAGKPEGTVIMMTEKDAVKLYNSKKIPAELRKRLFFVPLRISFHEDTERDFLNKLENDVRTNPKHSLLHP